MLKTTKRLALVSLLLPLLASCGKAPAPGESESLVYQVLPVSSQDIVVTVSASGALEPIRSVEVKSKASGEIIEMPVELGDRVAAGDLLVRIDPRQVNNLLEQSEAALEVARVRLQIAKRQKERAEALYQEGQISEQSRESSLLDYATAVSGEVSARTNLDQARERVEDSDIRASLSGTVIVKAVETGQIISSATSQVTGGTTLLTMANLDTLQVRTMVDETDIGKIRPDLGAEITVDAYPRELFSGRVLKIEPMAVTRQNVTTFPVLVLIANERGLLKPGMNVDVEIKTASKRGVLALPAEALRTERDYLVAAGAMGLGPEEAQALMASASRGGRGRSGVVFLMEGGRPIPVPVGIGIANWDFAEVRWGVSAGDSVAVTFSSNLLRQQDRWRSRMKNFSNMGFKKDEGKKTETRNGKRPPSRKAGKRPERPGSDHGQRKPAGGGGGK